MFYKAPFNKAMNKDILKQIILDNRVGWSGTRCFGGRWI